MTGPTRLTCAGALIVLAGLAPAVAAQDRADIGIGYQFQRLSATGASTNLAAGFNADVAVRVVRHVSAVGQVDWSRKSESTTYAGVFYETTTDVTTFGGGIRFSNDANPAVTPFVQVLAGASRFSSSALAEGLTDATIQVGGGLAFPFSERVAGVAQVDYRRIMSEGEAINSFRGVFGIRLMVK